MVNARKKWNNYEVKIMNEYKEMGYHNCKTSRNESKTRDDQKVDLCNTNPFNIQCKNYTNFSMWQAIKTLKEMPKETNINLIHLKTTKVGERWEVVILAKEDWYILVEKLKNNLLFD